jgi:hypothetical protein
MKAMGAGRGEISRASFNGKTVTMGVSGEHGDAPDVVLKRPGVSMVREGRQVNHRRRCWPTFEALSFPRRVLGMPRDRRLTADQA